jgi:hypothetical protein
MCRGGGGAASYTNGSVVWVGGRRPWAGLAQLGCGCVGALKLELEPKVKEPSEVAGCPE